MDKNENKIFVENFTVGPMGVNCYVVADPETRDACIIDPGAQPDKIKNCLRLNRLNPKFVINTHGHGDHIAANGAFSLPIYIHKLDSEFLVNPVLNMSKFFIFSITSPKASLLLEGGQELVLGKLTLKILHTPGHTPGSVSISVGGAVFTGDALFEGSIGRTDFPYGDEAELMRSIKEKLLPLSDDTIIYPGHGESSTIGSERHNNPFLI